VKARGYGGAAASALERPGGPDSVERTCEPMNKNRIQGVADQGERARNREAVVVKDQAAVAPGILPPATLAHPCAA